ncbi:MAG: amino acid-binding ACT domain-containing protein [Nitrospirae bacterium]|nr:MAG: amino acid-binding ACT domain-containing protein [Nitrospirota bacterium]
MKVKQISVFLENRKGRLYEVLNVLATEKINIRALSIADTADFGILRLIVPDPDAAKKVLEKGGFTVKENNVIAIEVPDRPGGLSFVLKALQDCDINVEYLYAFVAKSQKDAIVVIRTENNDGALKALKHGEVKVLTPEELYGL